MRDPRGRGRGGGVCTPGPPPEGETPEEAPPIRVVARVRRTSAPLQPADIAPYRDAFVCTEYEVEACLDGDPGTGCVFAIAQTMKDAEMLPTAAVEIGTAFELTLFPWETQPALHGYPVADDVSSPADPLYYVAAAKPIGDR